MTDQAVNADVKGDENNDQAQAQGSDKPAEKGAQMIPKERFDSVNEKRKAAEKALDEVATELTGDVPEDMRDMIPDLPPSDKIKWLRNAIRKGLFGKPSPEGIDTKRPGGKAPNDLEGMTPHEMRKAGYKT